MPASLSFFLALAVLIAAAKLGGAVTLRLGQAAVVGELVVGVLLGPTVLDLFHWPVLQGPDLEETILLLAELGVLLLMFVAGLEVDAGQLLRSGRAAVAVGVLGVAAPILIAAGTAMQFGFEAPPAVFLGLVLAATSVSISAQVLIELDRLRSPEGLTLLAAAVVDDILVILLLSVFIALTASGTLAVGSLLLVLGRMAAYGVLAAAVGVVLLPRVMVWAERLRVSQGVIAATLVIVLLYGWAAEALGAMAPITGSFLAGIFLARTPLKQHIETRIHTLSYGLVVPIFFVSIGLQTDLRALAGESVPFLLLLVAGAFLSKYAGGLAGAVLGGLSAKESSRVGIGMISRGEVGLIVATVGLAEGLVDARGFAGVVMVVVATTIVTPILLKMSYSGREASDG